jgi:Zn-dependent M28 family amino/carboxypeptidase
MRGWAALVLWLLCFVAAAAAGAEERKNVLSGRRALEHIKALTQAGQRVPGTQGHAWAQAYIIRHLRLAFAVEIEEVDFAASTPRGTISMKNIIGKFPGRSDEIIILAGHYDTFDRESFVGANDAGSSTALLLEMARALGRQQLNDATVWVVFFDGEEALESWGPRDGIYGSRYQAGAWQRDGTLARIKAVIVVDMIGDSDLTIRREANSTAWLTDLLWEIAREKGYGAHFLEESIAVEDDHAPFLRLGVPAVDLIDFDYGPGNRYWHTSDDTIDKVSSRSLQIVGEVVLEAVARLSQRWPVSVP